LRYLFKAIEIEPSNPDPYLYAGQVLARSEKTHEAIKALRKSIALTKEPGRNNYQVSNAEYILGQTLLKSGNREEAVQHIKRSQELKRLQYQAAQVDFQARTLTGVSAAPSGMASHDFRDLRDVEPGPNLNSPSPDEQAQAGHKSAERLYRNIAAKALQTVAGLASERQDFASAVVYLETAVRLTPEEPDLFRQLSQAYARAGRHEQAEKALEKYKELLK
jgi:tetratricopeptide (TPR) repeat protein